MKKAIRSFTILHNESNTARIKITLQKTDDGYGWIDDDGNTIADEGTIYQTVKKACAAAKAMYNNQAWEMKSTW